MERLSTLDASFLYMETPETPMHVAGLGVFAPPPAGADVFKDFHDHIAARLHLLPFFERRLNAIPAAVDNPVWIHEANVDLDYHIRQMALPRPGSIEQLRTLVARLHMILLDRSRPLWQYYVIEGLEGGGFAVYVKMHHSGIDGGAGMAALDIIFGASPDPAPVARPPAKKSGAAEPTLLELVGKTYEDFWAQQRRMLEALPDMGKALATVGRRLIEDLGRPNTVTLAPKTIFNVAVSKQRSFGTTTIPLAEVKAIGRAAEAKVNDVVMAVCAGALRRYLLERSALPRESLIAALPVSLREPGNTDMNNQVTMMLCSLSTDIADPLPRLAAIVASSQDSKARLGDVKGAMPSDISILGAPFVMTGLAEWMGRTKAADQLPAMVNVLISNVPGPRKPMYCAGAQLEHYFPVSIPSHGGALNITVQSYMNNLDFGLIGCRAAVPDIQQMAELLVQEFETLKEAAGKNPSAGAARRTVNIKVAGSDAQPAEKIAK
jgi:WS/DGAT/MGAT family acyltransferase